MVGESRAGAPADRMLGPGEAIAISTGAMVPAGADAVVRVEDTERDGAVGGHRGRGRPGRRRASRRRGRRGGRGGAWAGRRDRAGGGRGAGRRRQGRGRLRAASAGGDPEHRGRAAGARRAAAPGGRSQLQLLRARRPRASAAAPRSPRSRSFPTSATRPRPRSPTRSAPRSWSSAAGLGRRARPRPTGARGARRRAEFWGVALRPGKPTYFGVAGGRAGGATLVFGLPGNPVSALVTFLLFVRPAIRTMLGAGADRRRTSAVLDGRLREEPRPGARGPLPARAARRRLARDADRCPGLARPHLDARRRRARDHPVPARRRRRRGAGRGRAPRLTVAEPRRATIRRMEVNVRLFAVLRERAGRDELDLELPDGATVGDALAAAAREPGLDERAPRASRCARRVNREYVGPDAAISPGDEIALIPPVSGGAATAAHARVTGEPLDVEALRVDGRAPGRRGRGRLLRGHPRRRQPRVRGLRRDGRAADRRDPRGVHLPARARGGGGRASGRLGAARGAERRRRGRRRAPPRGVRGGARGDRPDQGRGADLEARGRGRPNAAGSRARRRRPRTARA